MAIECFNPNESSVMARSNGRKTKGDNDKKRDHPSWKPHNT